MKLMSDPYLVAAMAAPGSFRLIWPAQCSKNPQKS
jgi:hypothetical protein